MCVCMCMCVRAYVCILCEITRRRTRGTSTEWDTRARMHEVGGGKEGKKQRKNLGEGGGEKVEGEMAEKR